MLFIKLKAFLIHLSLSAVVLTLIMALIIIFWFPSPFLGITNFKEIAVILILVDLVLGPLLTFVAYNPKKKSLKLDLGAVIAVQVIALSYGLYSLYLSHPLYISYYNNSFNVVSTNLATPEKAKDKRFKISKLSSPKMVFLNVSDSDRNTLFTDMLNGKADIEARAEYYEPYQNHLAEIIANSLDPKIVFKDKPARKKLNNFLSKNGSSVENYVFVPLNGTSKKVVWILQKNTGKPVDIIDIKPIYTAKN